MARFERELLEAVAEEMNKVMGLTPAMDFAVMEDGTLLDTIVMEATGRGVVKDAVRADDFESADPDKMLFSKRAHAFFVEASVWDDRAKRVIMPKTVGKVETPAIPVEKKTAKPAAKAEAAAQENMEAGEDEPELPLAGKPEPVAKAKKKDGKAKAAPAAPAGKAPEAKEEPVKTKAAAKKGAAKKATVKKEVKEKGPGVIATIVELITEHGPITKEKIVEKLAKKFPDRSEDSMAKTVNVQIPGRIQKEKGIKLEEVEGKGWKIKGKK